MIQKCKCGNLQVETQQAIINIQYKTIATVWRVIEGTFTLWGVDGKGHLYAGSVPYCADCGKPCFY